MNAWEGRPSPERSKVGKQLILNDKTCRCKIRLQSNYTTHKRFKEIKDAITKMFMHQEMIRNEQPFGEKMPSGNSN